MSAHETIESQFAYYTEKAGDVVRQLGLAGVGAIWIFRATRIAENGAQVTEIPRLFYISGLLIILGLAIDVLQYIVGSVSWGEAYLGEKDPAHKMAPDTKASELPGHVCRMYAFIVTKLTLMAIAYGFLTIGLLQVL